MTRAMGQARAPRTVMETILVSCTRAEGTLRESRERMANARNQGDILLVDHMVAADDSHSDSIRLLHPTTPRRCASPGMPSFAEGWEVLVCGFERKWEWGAATPTVSCSDLPYPMDPDRARALTPWVEKKGRTQMVAYHRRLVDVGGGCDTSVGQKGCGEDI